MSLNFPYSSPQVTIANGAALSSATQIGSGVLVGIIMPAAWTAAAITFQASIDGVNFYPMYDANGVIIQVGATADPIAGAYIAIGSEINAKFDHFRGALYLKLQSSTAGSLTAVNQGAARVLTLVVDKSLAGGF